jgi:hypothetical protein
MDVKKESADGPQGALRGLVIAEPVIAVITGAT